LSAAQTSATREGNHRDSAKAIRILNEDDKSQFHTEIVWLYNNTDAHARNSLSPSLARASNPVRGKRKVIKKSDSQPCATPSRNDTLAETRHAVFTPIKYNWVGEIQNKFQIQNTFTTRLLTKYSVQL